MTVAKLPEFVRHLTEDYRHDYGTICHAIAAAGIAACWAVEHSPQGGITGFQAGCILWELIGGWQGHLKGKPLRLLQYEDMLYPQYEHKFREISKETWATLQASARKLLAETHHPVCAEVRAHWESVVSGVVPFGYAVAENS